MHLPDPSAALPDPLHSACERISAKVEKAGGRALLVGGCVRDALMGHEPKDVDIEVFGIEVEELERLLAEDFAVDWVGKAFGVFKLKGREIDVSLPRRESKSGQGHKAFAVEGDPEMSFEEAASRRDFTINAISWDLASHVIIDPFDGCGDIERGVLRHVSEKFSEDPLRVLRAMQFAARFDLEIAGETVGLCSRITPENLPPERIFEEWKKLVLKGVRPSRGLNFLKDCGWLSYYPELEALVGCEQEPEWHPEGDVWVHTLHCMDAFAGDRIGEEFEDLVVGFAVLCHDLGKPATTVFEEGRIRSPNHDVEGEAPTRSFLGRMTRQKDLVEAVVPLVLTHLRPVELYKVQASDAAVRRLARKVERIDRLVRVAQADMKGRPPKDGDDFPAGAWLLERAHALAVEDSAPKPIVMGRHLIDLGLEPGREFKEILNACYEAQLDGAFSDEGGGIAFVQQLLKGKS